MKKIVASAVFIASTLGLVGVASAGDYNACTVSDIQWVKVGTTNYYVFKAACANGTFFWYAPTDTDGNRMVSSLVSAAALSNRQINIQCGTNGGSCNYFSTKVYSSNVQGTNTIWSAETVNLR